MKRYRIYFQDFDSRANLLNWKIEDFWDENLKKLHRESKKAVREGLIEQFGAASHEIKERNFIDFGAVPMSVLAYHNRFFRQIQNAFVVGGYYPALTGACSLGERILNHLVLALRNSYKATPEYKRVWNKESFDDWTLPIDTLRAWGVFRPEVVDVFMKFRQIRNNAIHFRAETDLEDRQRALEAISALTKIIELQFPAFGSSPWFIENTPGLTFLKKSVEPDPFIRTVYIPNCVHVGIHHEFRYDRQRGCFKVFDGKYEDREISDEEYVRLFNESMKAKATRKANS